MKDHDVPLDSPEVLRVAELTHCVADPGSDFPAHFPGEVIVHLKDGRSLRCRRNMSLGTPEVPLSRAAIKAKFMSNATRGISAEAAGEIADKVLALETLASIDEVVGLCES